MLPKKLIRLNLPNRSRAGQKEEYFILQRESDEREGLLGDDFISKSQFIHEADQEIEVDSFDDKKYAERFAQFISEKEVYEILDLCILE